MVNGYDYPGGGYPTNPQHPSRRKLLLVAALAVVAVLIIVAIVVSRHQTSHPHSSGQQGGTTSRSGNQSGNKSGNAGNGSSTGSNSPGQPTSAATNSTLSTILDNDDNPNGVQYTVTAGSEPVSGWYVVHVTAQNSYGTFQQIAVLHQAPGESSPDVVAGPDTSFPISYLNSAGVPQSVINMLPTYDDTQN